MIGPLPLQCVTFRYQMKVPELLVSWTALYRLSPPKNSRGCLAGDYLMLFVELTAVDDDCTIRGS